MARGFRVKGLSTGGRVRFVRNKQTNKPRTFRTKRKAEEVAAIFKRRLKKKPGKKFKITIVKK
ncbi:hypothetical protein CMI37_21845 [Candidatus Pacearchaeota archaeon]|nr:hypothetical protein [Candidatus Pacearchaeota archaeon]